MFFMHLAAREIRIRFVLKVSSGSKYEPSLTTALTLTGTWRPFRRSGNVLNAQGQNAFRQRSERVRISVLASSADMLGTLGTLGF